jgi:hypothetical protein
VGGNAIGMQKNADFARLNTVERDLGDTVDAFEAAAHVAIEQFIGFRQIATGTNAQAQNGLINIGELAHEHPIQVVGQQVTNAVNLVARFHPFGGHVGIPAEEHEQAGIVLAGIGVHALDAAHGREHILDRPGDQTLDLFRRTALVRHLHHHPRKIDIGKELQRQHPESDQPQ